MALQQIIHPIDQADIADSKPELREQKFGKVQLECVMLSQPIKGVPEISLGLFPTYCAQGNILRTSLLNPTLSVVSQKLGTFQGHGVAVKVQVSSNQQFVLEADVEQLRTETPEDSKFDTAQLQKGSEGTVRISGGVMAGKKIEGPAPGYPQSARQNRESGTVVLQVRIGEDGHVHMARVMSSPDPALSLSSLIAVQQWVYTPYTLNGVPTSVLTTVTVNFALNVR